MFVMGASVDTLLAGKTLASAKEVLQSLSSSLVTPAELEQVKGEAVTSITKELAKPDGMADAWLDGDTYGLPSVAEQIRALTAITPADIQRVATRMVRDGNFASVVVGNSEVMKVEIMGEIAPQSPAKLESKSDRNSKPQTKPPAKPE
jgi:predicted Zn-dependent peptidase